MHDTRTKRKNIKNSENLRDLRDIVPSIVQHCPALPSPFASSFGAEWRLQKLRPWCCAATVSFCYIVPHGATVLFIPWPLNPLSHVWILAHITGSASKLLVEVDPEQNCRPKADDEDSLLRSSFFSSKINWFAKQERRFDWWLEQGDRLSCEHDILMNQQTQKGRCLTKLTNYIILPYCWKCCFLCKLSVRTQPSCRSA